MISLAPIGIQLFGGAMSGLLIGGRLGAFIGLRVVGF